MPEFYPGTTNRHPDPYRKFQWKVEVAAESPFKPWNGDVLAFSEVSGLQDSTEVVTYKEGDRLYDRKAMGKTSFADIVMSRGVDANGALKSWRQRIHERNFTPFGELRAHLIFTLYDRDGSTRVAQWERKWCWPTDLETESLDGNASDILIQRVTLACEDGSQLWPMR